MLDAMAEVQPEITEHVARHELHENRRSVGTAGISASGVAIRYGMSTALRMQLSTAPGPSTLQSVARS